MYSKCSPKEKGIKIINNVIIRKAVVFGGNSSFADPFKQRRKYSLSQILLLTHHHHHNHLSGDWAEDNNPLAEGESERF